MLDTNGIPAKLALNDKIYLQAVMDVKNKYTEITFFTACVDSYYECSGVAKISLKRLEFPPERSDALVQRHQ